MNHRGTEAQRSKSARQESRDSLSERVIGLAIEVHRGLGPGLLESAYEECLAYELKNAGMAFARQVPLPVIYKSVKLDCGYRMDFVVDRNLVIELKTVERLLPIHDAQLLTYLKLGNLKTGLLLNFHAAVLREGIRRMIL
ncbi:MAG TPA: GxxExxY protein [Candidatus Udaeobacter sp.]|nr:GxxExxY protein [Candidatus Udaeobacter sp.]